MKKHYLTYAAARRGCYLLFILSAYILQFIVVPRTGFSVSVPFLIPVGIAVSIYEKEFSGMLWGLLTGVLWDMSSPHTDGIMAVIFTALFLLTGLLSRYTLRNTLQTALLLSAAASLIPTAVSLLYSVTELTAKDLSTILTKEALPTLIFAVLLTIPVYPSVRAVSKRFHRERS